MVRDNDGSRETIIRLLPIRQEMIVVKTRLRADCNYILKVWYKRQVPNIAVDMYPVKAKQRKHRFLELTCYSSIPKLSFLMILILFPYHLLMHLKFYISIRHIYIIII